jgi:WD40 repeat protein
MQISNVPFSLILTILISIGCVSSAYTETCKLKEGKLSVAVNVKGASQLITWSANDKIKRKSTSASYYSNKGQTNIYSGTGDKRAANLPQDLLTTDYRLDTPFAFSHDNKMLISAVYENNIALIPSREAYIINSLDKKVIKNIKTDYLLSLAWSPSDKYIALLLSKDVTGQKWRGPLHWLYRQMGHPISYYNLTLGLYSRNGEFICFEIIEEQLELGTGYIIDWVK